LKKQSVGILGMGSYVPDKVLTNFNLEKIVDTTDEWIRTRTGIQERRIAPDGVASSDLGAKAAMRALADAGLGPEDIPLIITATITPDYQFPSTACLIQTKLGVKNAMAFDINAACSGFIYALEIAKRFISSGMVNKALVVGAEKLSSIIDWKDRSTSVLLGDGAGAAVVGEVEDGKGILGSFMRVEGAYGDLLKVPAGGSAMPATNETVNARMHFMKMEGPELFKHAVKVMCNSAQEVIKQCGFTAEDIDWVVPHQANIRIMDAVGKRLKTKIYANIQRYGNTSAASIPIALDEALREGTIKKGQRIVLVAFGAGLTWGANVMQL